MSKGTAIDLGLTEAYNDLFSTQAERDNAGRSYVMDIFYKFNSSVYIFLRSVLDVFLKFTFLYH